MNAKADDFEEIIRREPSATRFILVRHGETDWNRAKRFQGHTDIPLNEQGLAQANQLALYFKRLESIGLAPYQHCISSDLDRAFTTAATIHGDRQPPVELRCGLRERDYGHLSGLTADEMELKSPVEYSGLRNRLADSHIEGGESLDVFYQRVVSTFGDLCNQYENSTVLLVAHGGVLDCIYRHCSGELLERQRNWQLPNCALNVVELDFEGNSRVLLWGWLDHLKGGSNNQNMDEVDGRIA